MRLLFADFETRGIEPRPDYPPKPVGLALRPRGGHGQWQAPRYFAFGHDSGNNSTEAEAKRIYRGFLRDGYLPVFHNAGFDLDVAETHWGCRWPAEWHDTLLLAFLHDPRYRSFALKSLAHAELGEPPTEQDELLAWLKANVPEARKKPTQAMAWIFKAPGKLAGRYACGDVARTVGLFDKFWADVGSDGRLLRAYGRERRLTPCLIKMERRGVPTRTAALGRDLPRFQESLLTIEGGILRRLRVPVKERADFTFTGDRLADALERAGKVKEWILTDKGNRATNAEDLREVCLDGKLVDELEVRSQMQTCVSTFMTPWLAAGREHGGRFYARFNQVRQESEYGGQVGAVSGRLSMSPNLQNVIRPGKDPRVPILRDYIWSGARGLALVQRDYSQQELRILAHYEAGPFLAMYMGDPTIDAHEAVRELVRRTVGMTLTRRDIKDLNFGLLYGMGLEKLGRKLKRTVTQVRELKQAHVASLPGVKWLNYSLRDAARANQPLWTWGGRRYYCEEPRMIKGELRTFEYKMMNYKIQASAADMTKQAMVNYFEAGHDGRWPLLLQVHDELLAIARSAQTKAAHRALCGAMLDVTAHGEPFEIPMLSDGKTGAVSWHRMKKIDY